MWRYLVVFNLLLILSTSCDPIEEDLQKCYSVINKNTGNPIGGAKITIDVERGTARYRWYEPFYGTTNANGKACFYYEGIAGRYNINKEGYVRICNSQDFSETIELTPAAILILHIQDKAPPSNYTLFFVRVTFPSDGCSGERTELWQDDETNMDTIGYINLRPGSGSVYWSWHHNNIRYEADKHVLDLTSGDTTYFEIVY